MANYTINDLLYLMARLRDPNQGCPWDLKQTSQTLIQHSIEEVYELVDAIESANSKDIQAELGDVLFQVVFLARIAEEQQQFDFHQLVDQLCSKLIRRHPHIFIDGQLFNHGNQNSQREAISEQQVSKNWEAIKAAERVTEGRAGLFDDLDVALHWHADSKNSAGIRPALANKSAKFRFYGVAAHAAGAPEMGRSALDAVEAMNAMVNMMREHVTDDTRIHYVITRGGEAPNVVPDFAEVYYYSRHTTRDEVIRVFDRIVNAAKGAALGTGTTMDYEMIGGTHELLYVPSLQKRVQQNLEKIGGYTYNSEEKAFAEEISKTLNRTLSTEYVEGVKPYSDSEKAGGSTDVGDVSFAVPTAGLRAATWVPGTPAHSWQAVAAGGTTIGEKGMMVAAKTLTLTGMQLFDQAGFREQINKEFIEVRGSDFEYIPLLGDREPALNYRN